jgi:hypothetical protein
MTDDTLTRDQWYSIQRQLRSQGLGTGHGILCAGCNRTIEEEHRAKAYIVGRGSKWRISRIFHPGCGDRFTEDRIGEYDEQGGLVYGTVRNAPAIARTAADDRSHAEQVWCELFQEDALSVIETDLPAHVLIDVEVGEVFIPDEGTFTEAPEL